MGLALALILQAGALQASSVSFIPEDRLPRQVAVGPVIWTQNGQRSAEAEGLIRDSLINYLAGKGFEPVARDRTEPCRSRSGAGAVPAARAFAACLRAKGAAFDGVTVTVVHRYAAEDAIILENYELDGELLLFDAQANALGSWRDHAQQQGATLSLDPLASLFSSRSGAESGGGYPKRRRLIFDWAFNLTALMPGFSGEARNLRIMRVVHNGLDRALKVGDRLEVGVEGDRGRQGVFSIGQFRADLPLAESSPGVYHGVYAVQEGDRVANAPLTIILSGADGRRGVWTEGESLVTIDGVPPPPPRDLRWRRTPEGLELTWGGLSADVVGFVVSRSERPLDGFQESVRVRELRWIDAEADPERSWFYRIAALDAAGNLSVPLASEAVGGPQEARNAAPAAERGITPLQGDISGTLEPGLYRLVGEVSIPPGATLTLAPGVQILGGAGDGLRVQGTLTGAEALFRMAEQERWEGLRLEEGGRLTLTDVTLKGCGVCLTQSGGRARFEGGAIKEAEIGVELTDGVLEVVHAAIRDNDRGVVIHGGRFTLEGSNLHDNASNLESDRALSLAGNYLGHTRPNRLRLSGPVTVRSVLDAPWPGGAVTPFDPEAMTATAARHREAGMAAFQGQRFGEAYQSLRDALDYSEDPESRLMLAYTLHQLGRGDELERLLEEAYENYPNDVRFFRLGVRRLMNVGQSDAARLLLERALRLNPADSSLQGLRAMLE